MRNNFVGYYMNLSLCLLFQNAREERSVTGDRNKGALIYKFIEYLFLSQDVRNEFFIHSLIGIPG